MKLEKVENLGKRVIEVVRKLQEEKAKNQDSTPVVIGLSGGSLPKILGEQLQQEGEGGGKGQVKWEECVYVACDERCVEREEEDANHHALLLHLFAPLSIPSRAVLWMPAPSSLSPPSPSPSRLAAQYEALLRDRLGPVWRMDVALLGMGDDGHTCSLFPGDPLLEEKSPERIRGITNSPKPPPERITMTLEALNESGHVFFVCKGQGKAGMVRNVVGRDPPPPPLPPARLVNPPHGLLVWFLDDPAASLLPSDLW